VTAVDHRPRPLDLTSLLELGKKQRMQLVLDSRLLLLIETAPAGRARPEAKLARQMPPRDPRVEHNRIPLSASRSPNRLRPG